MRKFPFHPLLFAIFPVISLLGYNVNEIKFSYGLRALLVYAVAGGILFALLRLILRDWHKAALLSSLLLVLFFTYGYIYNYLEQTNPFGIYLGRHRLLFPLWLLITLVGAYLILRRLKDPANLTAALNIAAIAALVIPAYQITSFQIRMALADAKLAQAAPDASGLHLSRGKTLPDIYYIILDSYTRDDVLKDEFNYDNSAFIQGLTDMGFHVARCSQSNYAQTELSLSSSLNLDYLPALGSQFSPEDTDRSILWPLLRKNVVRSTLKGMGYTVVAFETGYYWTQWEDADIYYSRATQAVDPTEQISGLNNFEVMLLQKSAALVLTDASLAIPKSLTPDVDSPVRSHRERVLYAFDKLGVIPLSVKSPFFAFVHIVAPHDPFVFGPQGQNVRYPSKVDDATYGRGYSDQVTYVNTRTLQAIRTILDSSATPPIIVIQGDHGPAQGKPAARMAILNAYYLPDGGDQGLYASITPVNTFRLIFYNYFGAHYDLLPDKSYFSGYTAPYQFQPLDYPRDNCK